jgi:hypothetical protein
LSARQFSIGRELIGRKRRLKSLYEMRDISTLLYCRVVFIDRAKTVEVVRFRKVCDVRPRFYAIPITYRLSPVFSMSKSDLLRYSQHIPSYAY